LYGHSLSVILVIYYVREKKRKKKEGPNGRTAWGLTARGTFLAIHEEVVEKGRKV
jgi:hypothetical protein